MRLIQYKIDFEAGILVKKISDWSILSKIFRKISYTTSISHSYICLLPCLHISSALEGPKSLIQDIERRNNTVIVYLQIEVNANILTI